VKGEKARKGCLSRRVDGLISFALERGRTRCCVILKSRESRATIEREEADGARGIIHEPSRIGYFANVGDSIGDDPLSLNFERKGNANGKADSNADRAGFPSSGI